MMKVLRNLNINTMVAGALVCCALLVSVLAVLRFTTNEMVDDSISTLNQINVQQLNEVSRAAVLLNRARIQMDLAADYLDQGMRLVAENQIDGVEGLLERAQNRFDNFDETPKTEMGRARASELATGFNTVMGLVRDQYAALKADGEVTIAERERVQAAYEQEIKVQRLKAEGDATVAKRRAMEEVYK